MKWYTTREARAKFGEGVRRTREEPVGISRHGRVAAILVSPEEFDGMLRLQQIVNSACVVAGVRQAVDLLANGESKRGLGLFRALAPYWRRSGIKSAPRDCVKPDKPRIRNFATP